MVHRMQNRNPGYSDFSSNDGSTSLSFSNTNSNPISHGANALKLENEVVSQNIEDNSIDRVNQQYHEELLRDQNAESIVENTNGHETSFSQEAVETEKDITDTSKDRKEFGVNAAEPDLFNSESSTNNSENLLNSSEADTEEDELEIPAFLRRQKN